MPSRRAARIALILALLLIAVGLGALVYGISPAQAVETDRIAAGWEYFDEFQWGVIAGGSVQGTWDCLNGTPVQVFVYNDAQYSAYANGANLTGLYNVTAVSGTLSLAVTGFNTYHVVIQHGAGYENTTQDVAISLTSTGADPTFTIGGVLALVVGGVLLVYALRRSRKAAAPPGNVPQWDTFQPSPPRPAGRDAGGPGTGPYRVPPPRPGSAPGGGTPMPPPAAPAARPAAGDAAAPVGTVLVTVENHAGTDTTLDLVVNGAAVTSMTVPAGGSRQVSVAAKLSSPFGSTVTVEAVLAGGRRARQAVFVGARGTAPVTLRIG